MESFVLDIFRKCLDSAHPLNLFEKKFSILKDDKIRISPGLIVNSKNIKFISFGKAGGTMAEALLNTIGLEKIAKGIIVLPEYSKEPNIDTKKIEIKYSTHPFVSEKSVEAGNRVLDFADNCKAGDIVFCLVSGGGSALLASPVDGIRVTNKISLINKLIKMGIGEREVNIIRKRLSKIKGGSLAQRIYPAKIINIVLSDEREHQLEAIASGPTVENTSELTAKTIINENHLWDIIPKEMQPLFDKIEQSQINPYPKIDSIIIGSREDVLQEFENVAFKDQLNDIKVLTKFYDNDIVHVKNDLLSYYSNYYSQAKRGKYLIVASGEVPIKVKSANGKGGRNQHLAALMIEELKRYNNFQFLAISSDGCDFLDGVHGALIWEDQIKKIDSFPIDVRSYIYNFNSYDLHKQIGSLVEGPMTGTNVNDFYLFYFEK